MTCFICPLKSPAAILPRWSKGGVSETNNGAVGVLPPLFAVFSSMTMFWTTGTRIAQRRLCGNARNAKTSSVDRRQSLR
jgi:hypothetical protein